MHGVQFEQICRASNVQESGAGVGTVRDQGQYVEPWGKSVIILGIYKRLTRSIVYQNGNDGQAACYGPRAGGDVDAGCVVGEIGGAG